MSKKTVCPLFSPSDGERARPILDALRDKGFHISKGAAENEKAPMLLFLSAAFAADENAQEAFFSADGAGREIIPVDLDGAVQSELVRSALMAKNAITAQGRTAEEIAERVASAGAFAKKKTPKWLAPVLIAAAVLIAVGAAVWLRPGRAPEEEPPAPPEPDAFALARERYGLSEEDLADIVYVCFSADRFFYCKEAEVNGFNDNFSTYSPGETGMLYYSTEDGRELFPASYRNEELEILSLMPKLQRVKFELVDAEKLPDLSGLSKLNYLMIADCGFTDLSGLAGSPLRSFVNLRCPIEDYSPLSSCQKLRSVEMEFGWFDGITVDLSGFSLPALNSARFAYSGENMKLDLSGLKNCAKLEELSLSELPIEDLDSLSGLAKLSFLDMNELPRLRDVSALGTLKSLKYLRLHEADELRDVSAIGKLTSLHQLDIGLCDNITDLSAIKSCTELQALNLVGMSGVTDLSFLTEMRYVSSAGILSTPLRDSEYLKKVAQHSGEQICVSLDSSVSDVSGLRYITRFNSILLCSGGDSLDYFLSYLEKASGYSLWLNDFPDSELPAVLPELKQELKLENCRLVDLRGLPAWGLTYVRISGDPALRSLDGIEALETLGNGTLRLELCECPLLGDLSALEGAYLDELSISDMLNVPELRDLRVKRLRLENITELADLGCLDGLDASQRCDIALVGLDELRDLTPLRRFRGECLTVPPHLAEQAAELVESGNFARCEIEYPEGSWQLSDEDVTLLSLDEMESLPGALLRHVRRLCLAGDVSADTDVYMVWEHIDEQGKPFYVLVRRDTEEETPIKPGTLTALPELSALEGLRELQIYCQNLRDLEGVQVLASLEAVCIGDCAALEDASALFTLQGLRQVEITGCPLASVQGVQNLSELEEINLSHTAVEDLTPLLGLSHLRRVTVSPDMKKAIASLEGAELPFELNF